MKLSRLRKVVIAVSLLLTPVLAFATEEPTPTQEESTIDLLLEMAFGGTGQSPP
jgi:hypothetical protein